MDHNFLTPGVEQLRNTIRGIDESYNNSWDIIAELLQNAIDAIRLSDVEKGKIELVIDSKNREISSRDNGTGIANKKVPVLLKPFSTNKRNNDKTVGEKGVGLTFIMFSCNDFRLTTGIGREMTRALVKNALSWKNGTGEDMLPLEIEEVDENMQGTLIELKQVDENVPIFKWNFKQLEYILRTKTALGTTNIIWGDDKEIDITIRFIDQNGEEHEKEIPFSYWLPTEGVKKSAISLEEFDEFLKVDRSDAEKRKKIKGKIIYQSGEFKHSDQRKIKYYWAFVPERKTFNTLSINHGICTPEDLENKEWLDQFDYTLLNKGIYTSVKGMPTGISIDPPATGSSGYWYNLFILFEDPKLSFDIGRKSIHGAQTKIYREYAKEIFNTFNRKFAKYITEVDVPGPEKYNTRDAVFAEIEKLPSLKLDGFQFKKTPKDQEASVIALFFEAIGNGKLKDIQPLHLGYKRTYDLYAHLKEHIRTVIEFKSSLSNIAKDFIDAKKMFDEIDCIVCWDVDEDDEQKMNDLSLRLEEIDEEDDLLGISGKEEYPNATHKLILSGFTKPIYIIDLKKALAVKATV